MHPRNRVVVTGLGVVAPNGIGIDEFWRSLIEGRSGIGPITLFDTTGLRCKIAGEVKGFDLARYLPEGEKESRRMSRAQQFGIAAAKMAIRDSGLTEEEIQKEPEVPIFMGVSSSAFDLREGPTASWKPPAAIPHAVASSIAYTCGFVARLMTVSNGCASSLDAVGVATDYIRRGYSDLAIAGSADSVMTRYVFESFDKSRKMSTRNDAPERASRPFDRDRDGGLASEGAGIVLLESLERALSRGANPYLEITGYATAADPPGSPDGAGLERTMTKALVNASQRPTNVDAVNAHAPSDVNFDALETSLIKRVLGARAYEIPVNSIKGATGNPMGAAGVCQLIAVALSTRHGMLPPTTNFEHGDETCDLDYVPSKPRLHSARVILINSHGFGRGNASLVVESIRDDYPCHE